MTNLNTHIATDMEGSWVISSCTGRTVNLDRPVVLLAGGGPGGGAGSGGGPMPMPRACEPPFASRFSCAAASAPVSTGGSDEAGHTGI